jgi:hypothetical protein
MANGTPDPIAKAPPEVAMTVRELVLQVSSQIQAMDRDFQNFKLMVITRAEFDLFKTTQRIQRNWSIGIIVSILLAAPASVGAVVALLA